MRFRLTFTPNEKMPLQLVVSLLDQCQETLTQFMDFLIRSLKRLSMISLVIATFIHIVQPMNTSISSRTSTS